MPAQRPSPRDHEALSSPVSVAATHVTRRKEPTVTSEHRLPMSNHHNPRNHNLFPDKLWTKQMSRPFARSLSLFTEDRHDRQSRQRLNRVNGMLRQGMPSWEVYPRNLSGPLKSFSNPVTLEAITLQENTTVLRKHSMKQ